MQENAFDVIWKKTVTKLLLSESSDTKKPHIAAETKDLYWKVN